VPLLLGPCRPAVAVDQAQLAEAFRGHLEEGHYGERRAGRMTRKLGAGHARRAVAERSVRHGRDAAQSGERSSGATRPATREQSAARGEQRAAARGAACSFLPVRFSSTRPLPMAPNSCSS